MARNLTPSDDEPSAIPDEIRRKAEEVFPHREVSDREIREEIHQSIRIPGYGWAILLGYLSCYRRGAWIVPIWFIRGGKYSPTIDPGTIEGASPRDDFNHMVFSANLATVMSVALIAANIVLLRKSRGWGRFMYWLAICTEIAVIIAALTSTNGKSG